MSDLSLPCLACPLCKGNLKIAGMNQVECLTCKSVYPVDDGIPILLSSTLDKFKMLEAEFHSNVADEFTERNMNFSYRVTRYREDYLKYFSDCQQGTVILEVGRGGGLEAVQLKKMGHKVIESDISIGMVKTARKHAVDCGQEDRSLFVVCDAEQLPCPDQSLDAVLIVAALHHLPSPERFMAAASRALKPGGLLVIGFEPNRWPYFTICPVLRLLGRFLHPHRRIASGEISVGDMETIGFVSADFERFIKTVGLKKVRLQRIWFMNGFIHTALAYVNRSRAVGRLIDLPHALQRVLVACDEFLMRIPLLRELCWHWTLVAQRPRMNYEP